MRSYLKESSQKPNPRNTRHGLSLMKQALREHGTWAIDRRTSLGKALDHWRDQLVSDLGGAEQVSTQQLAIVNVAVKPKLLLDSLDVWLLKQPSLWEKRGTGRRTKHLDAPTRGAVRCRRRGRCPAWEPVVVIVTPVGVPAALASRLFLELR